MRDLQSGNDKVLPVINHILGALVWKRSINYIQILHTNFALAILAQTIAYFKLQVVMPKLGTKTELRKMGLVS